MRRLLLLLMTVLPSGLRVRALRALGHRVGRNCHIAPLSIIVADRIAIGNDTRISPLVVIYNLAEFRVGRGTIISYLGLIYSARPDGFFRAGERFAMGMLAMIDCSAGVAMGGFCSVGPRSILYTHANAMPTVHGFSSTYAGISLGDRVWLMMDVKVMPGVSITSDVHVAPTSFVARSVKRSGLFMNPYMAEKDVLVPLSSARRHAVDAAFLEAWFAEVLGDLPTVAQIYFKREIAVEHQPWGWRITEKARTGFLSVIDGRPGRPAAPTMPGPKLVLCHGVGPTDRALPYIDCLTLDYDRLEGLPFRDMIWLHFFVSHGMALAQAETEPVAVMAS